MPIPGLICLISTLLVGSTATLRAQDQTSYGFVRVIEGRADLMQASSNTLIDLVENYPLMVNDELRVPYGSRVETVLPDGTYLRLEGDTEVSLRRLALSADSEDRLSVLQLVRGETQLVLPGDTAAAEPFRVDTLNASVYLQNRGTYRIRTDGSGWSEIVVREGFAEVVTEQGSTIVRSGEQTVVEGQSSPEIRIERAGLRDELERWGDDLMAQAGPAESRYVEPSLAYASAPLGRHGHWVSVGGRSAWRPYVASGWRPYNAGWWVHSPSGLTWVSTEPWGWVTYHYGGWDYAPGWGWVWYPGPVYTPASVFWYWGPSYVGWVPGPYYTHYYWPSYYPSWGFGFHYSVFGWAGGRPHHWNQWTFCEHRNLGRHRGPQPTPHGSHYFSGAQLANRGGLQEIPRGVIASDTRALTPDLWNRPTDAMRALAASRVDAAGNRVGSELPDVSAWVARSPQLPAQVEQAVMPRSRVASPGSVVENPSARSLKAGRSLEMASSDRSVQTRQPTSSDSSEPVSPAWRSKLSASPPTARGSGLSVSPSGMPRSRVALPGTDPSALDSQADSTRSTMPSTSMDWRNRRTLGTEPSTRNETPIARRVWDGVRSYRERSRVDDPLSNRSSSPPSTRGLGSTPGYGTTPGQQSWSQRSTAPRYFGGFGSSPSYGGSTPWSTGSLPSSPSPSYRSFGSSPGYSGPQGSGVQSRSGASPLGGSLSGPSASGRPDGSSASAGGRATSSGRTASSSRVGGGSSPPPD
jgi:hypothetical protein